MQALVILSIFTLLGTSSAYSCPFRAYLDLEKQGPNRKTSTPVAVNSEWLQKLEALFQAGVQSTFEQYQSGKLTSDRLRCLSESSRLQEAIEFQFSQPFLIAGAKSLQASRSILIQTFAQKIAAQLSSGTLNPSKLNLHIASAPRPAGFDRSNRGLFFNLFQIEPQFFNLYLIHEFAHAFDPHLAQAINDFNNETLTANVAALVREQKIWVALSGTEKQMLRKYLLAGLNRGVLAELRAWLTTSELYLELLKHNEQAPAPFIDNIIGSKRALSREQLTQIWWQYLLQNFTRPNSGLLASPLLKDALDELLKELNPKDWI